MTWALYFFMTEVGMAVPTRLSLSFGELVVAVLALFLQSWKVPSALWNQ